jgi:hypothetical protein
MDPLLLSSIHFQILVENRPWPNTEYLAERLPRFSNLVLARLLSSRMRQQKQNLDCFRFNSLYYFYHFEDGSTKRGAPSA